MRAVRNILKGLIKTQEKYKYNFIALFVLQTIVVLETAVGKHQVLIFCDYNNDFLDYNDVSVGLATQIATYIFSWD